MTPAASSQKTRAVANASVSGEATAQPTPSPSRVSVDQIAASPEYFGVLDLAIVSGRGFTPAERSAEAGVAVIMETLARALWPNRNAVGQVVHLQTSQAAQPNSPLLPSRALTIVGVVRDVNGPLAPDFFPASAVYVPTGAENPGTGLTLRVRGDPEQARQALIKSLMTVDPGLGEIFFWVTIVLGSLALALTLSGLFSVLSYVVEQRVKDIGVRMALGASARNVAGQVLSQSFRPVGIGLTAGAGLATALAIVLMALDEAGELGNIVRVFDPVAYGASVMIIAIACLVASAVPARRAARIDPIATLRKD